MNLTINAICLDVAVEFRADRPQLGQSSDAARLESRFREAMEEYRVRTKPLARRTHLGCVFVGLNAILREIRNRTNRALDPGAGSLYGAIQKLLSEGAIEESLARPAPHLDDRRRRYYRITELGRRVASNEVERLREVVRFAHGKLAAKTAPPLAAEVADCKHYTHGVVAP